ncbi:MAG: sodium ion-translocating decarboxylase subunit beta, partial [Bacilli bacterium]|nr:sodium ion-translocating decarboxylase subunit beta [Bacilli bacterium]
MIEVLKEFWNSTGIKEIVCGNWQNAVMILIAFILMYLAIFKKFEPYLLIPIAFGMFLSNFPLANLMSPPTIADGKVTEAGGLI